LILNQNTQILKIIQKAAGPVEKSARLISDCLRSGGRLFFIGAGTSGRLGVLEAAECPPTFNTPPGLVQAIMAGGPTAVFRSREGAEDDAPDARRQINRRVRKGDVVVGVAASGVTPFVQSGLAAAKRRGARTILVTCNPRQIFKAADVVIAVDSGAEVITGSTRMKAGTCTKIVLNTLTTAAMIRLGKVYGHWMVDLQPKSKKLKARAIGLVARLGKVSPAKAGRLFQAAHGRAKTAILMARTGLSEKEATRRLKDAGGFLARALGD
jgi:N-acetylmuramic acid 6-phosphate etherase